jgi:hypothetical protein
MGFVNSLCAAAFIREDIEKDTSIWMVGAHRSPGVSMIFYAEFSTGPQVP